MNHRMILLLASAAGAIVVSASTLVGASLPGAWEAFAEVDPRIAINATNTPGDADSLFKITQPGSYYLEGNVTGASGKHGIEVASSDVTIDLMGFELAGVNSSRAGVSNVAGTGNITLRNGTVRDWENSGVDLGRSLTPGIIVEDVIAASNGGNGVAVGSSGIVRRVTALSNGSDGIFTNGYPLITECVVRGNAGNGINSPGGGSITRCVVTQNVGDGIRVIGRSVVTENHCAENGAGAGDGAGIHVFGSQNRLEGNDVAANDRGIDVDGLGNLIIRNSAAGNITEYDIVPGNTVGPIVTFATIGANLNPHANYDH